MASYRYDFIVSDFLLPGGRGYRLDEIAFLLEPTTKILLVSDRSPPAAYHRYPCLGKPVRLSELVEALEKMNTA
jgi:hypothetical protein